jgi:hypothetical protein
MGQEIVYCYGCQTRLLGSDFEKGHAFRVGAQVSCPQCVRGLFSSLPPAQIDAEIARLKETPLARKGGSSSRFPAVRAGSPESSGKMKAAPPATPSAEAPRSKLPFLLGGAGVVGLLLLGLVLSASPRRPPTSPVEAAPSPALLRPSAPPPAPGGILPPGVFVELDRQIAGRVEADDFAAAGRELEKAAPRRPEPAWAAGIEERRARLEAKARDALPKLMNAALAASREGRPDEVVRLRGFISAFPALAAEFDRHVAAAPAAPARPAPVPVPGPAPDRPPPHPGPASAPVEAASESASYRATWDQAMASRDPALIAGALEGILKGLKSADAKAEAARDLDLVKLAIPVQAEGLAALTKLPRDERVQLEFRDDAVVLGSLEGTLQAADLVRIRLSTDTGLVDLPASELSEEAIGRLYAGRAGHGPVDARAAAAWCAIRSCADGAGKLDPTLPAKYLEFARKAAPADPDGAGRRAFWAAFVEAGMNRSRAAGLDQLSKLSSPRYKPFIDLLLEGAREAFFSGTDFAVAGTFSTSDRDKLGTVWLSTADSKAGQASLEAEYYALPETTYRAWVLCGGCCLEVFSFSLQASGLRAIDPKTKQEATCEPGDPAGLPVKLPYLPLKKLHSQHLGPKEPSRWEWIPLALPKADAPGLKKIRILSEQKGFAVAQLVVSATRKGPPSPAELKELLKDRSTMPRFTVTPGLVQGKPTRTIYCGGTGGSDFEDLAPAGGVLVGLRYSPNGTGGKMRFVQPIYRRSGQTAAGAGHGSGDADMPELVAKPGYAVGQMVVMATDRLDGFKIVFMRHAGGRLLAADSYESPWVGLPPKGESRTLGDGSPVGGIFGHNGSEIDGFGLILLK